MTLEYKPYEYRMGSPKKEKQLIAIGIVSILIVTAFLVIGWGKLFGVLYEPDTETNKVVYDPLGWDVDATGNAEELLDNIAYVSSWRPEGKSEKIIIKAYWDFSYPSWYEWYVYLDPNGNWDNPMYKSTPDSPYSDVIRWTTTSDGNNPGRSYPGEVNDPAYMIKKPSHIIELNGKLSGMAIRVEWKVRCSGPTYGRTFIIHDEAKILDGSGNVVVMPSQDGDDVFEEGETVTFKVSTGASGISVGEPDKGWQLRLYKPDGTQYVGGGFPMSLSDFLEDYSVNWVVPQGAWSPTSNNRWYVRLYNILIEQSMDWFFTVDVAEKQPTMSSIEVSDETPTPPTTVTVTLTGEPNQYTQSPIDRFNVDIYYGLPNNVEWFIMEDALFTATNNQATFSFPVSTAGHITIEARCIDEAGRPSSPLIKGIDASGEPPPSERYAPGQMWTYTFDENIHYPVFPDYKPELIMYTFIDSNNKVIYVIKHTPDVAEKTGESGGNQYWHVTDTVSFIIPAFAKTGTWTVKIAIGDPITKIGPWELGTYLHQESTAFTVTKGSLAQNLLAPMYWHKHILGFDVNWKLPCPMVWIIIVAVIVGLVAVGIYQRERIIQGFRNLKRR